LITPETLEEWRIQIDSVHELVYLQQHSIDSMTQQIAHIHDELIKLGLSLKAITERERP
jgi:hypothetical protein